LADNTAISFTISYWISFIPYLILLKILSFFCSKFLHLLPEKRRLAAVPAPFSLQLTFQKSDDGFLHLLRRCVLRKVFFQFACVDFQGFFLVSLFLRHNGKYHIHVKLPA